MINNLTIILCTVTLLLILSIFRYIVNFQKKTLRLKEYQININAQITEFELGLLDQIIESCFQQYLIMNLEYKEIEVVNSNMEKEITTEISKMVMDRLSIACIDKISLIYNTNNLGDLITQKVYLHVLNYSIEKKKVKK